MESCRHFFKVRPETFQHLMFRHAAPRAGVTVTQLPCVSPPASREVGMCLESALRKSGSQNTLVEQDPLLAGLDKYM